MPYVVKKENEQGVDVAVEYLRLIEKMERGEEWTVDDDIAMRCIEDYLNDREDYLSGGCFDE